MLLARQVGAQQPGCDVAADIAADTGRELHRRFGADGEAQLRRRDRRRLEHGRRVGREPDLLRRQAEQEVGHHRVAGDRRVTDLARVDAAAEGGPADESVHGVQDPPLQLAEARRAEPRS